MSNAPFQNKNWKILQIYIKCVIIDVYHEDKQTL